MARIAVIAFRSAIKSCYDFAAKIRWTNILVAGIACENVESIAIDICIVRLLAYGSFLTLQSGAIFDMVKVQRPVRLSAKTCRPS